MAALPLSEKVRHSVALLFLSSFLTVVSTSSFSLAAETDRELSEEQKIIHVLNRLGFGPRLGDIERVKAMGIEAYIEQQLHPESIADPVVEEKLASLTTLKMTLQERLEADSPTGTARRRSMIRKLEGRVGTPSSQAIRESGSTTGRKSYNPRRMNPTARMAQKSQPDQLGIELGEAKLIRAVHSERQLLEVMVDFWFNHFNVEARRGGEYLTDYEQNVIRPRVLGKFEDLLIATAQHPAMLQYLDNVLSSAPTEVVKERLHRRFKRVSLSGSERRDLHLRVPLMVETFKGLNENYAREVMELHTVGVDGGYTQDDVIQVAKCFTGWTMQPMRGKEEGNFGFDPDLHEEGDKVVLGQTIKSSGVEEGMQVLKILAHHPSTARFISTKLVRRFVADDPPPELVEAASRTFERTGGDIREVLRTIFSSPQFFSAEAYQAKVKKPLELVASSLRAVNAQLKSIPMNRKVNNLDLENNLFLHRAMTQMGERLYRCEAPTGYPDVASAWLNTNALIKRLNFAFAMASGVHQAYRGPGGRVRPFQPNIKADLRSAQLLLEQLGIPRPDSEQIEKGRLLAEKAAQDQPEQGKSMMSKSMMDRGASVKRFDPKKVSTQAIAIALMLGSPQFQKR